MAFENKVENKAENKKGWSWFENDDQPTPEDNSLPDLLPDPGADISRIYARCFSGPDGEKVLSHLQSLTFSRGLGPSAKNALLRHVEGQRQLVAYIMSQVRHGRGE